MHTNNQTLQNSKDAIKHFDLYLFVNPIGLKCYHSEQEVLRYIESIADNKNVKIHFRFLTFHNFNTVSFYMRRMDLPVNDLQLRNQVYQTIYDASLAYKAALMQGKKRGRNFLLLLQKELTVNLALYSDQLLKKIAKGANLDVEMFFEDKDSDFVKSSYDADQRIGQEMNIKQTPSLVIFGNDNQQFGILLEEIINFERLEEAFNHSDLKLTQSNNILPVSKNYLQILK
ncbi:hypothetical protein BW727_100405 [Jeotgalibaca dankookensis]|uniref:Thioredoxin-like fold domain-containing protein n=1 Tax=Jeotgalibaca dankookensis TaxID=708126 RepID=A0A1S6IML4_9LACT|nr:DsbA family protein [Jeotgalibaca dankookensis]AQS52798.1 hypothetical protein BW727_100405 [Jeotgalibaca dankookensis]